MKQLDILKYGVGFFEDTAVRLIQPLTHTMRNEMCWQLKVRADCVVRRRHLEYELQGTVVALKSPEDNQ